MTRTASHTQTIAQHEVLRLWFPEHEPREQDPHYPIFHRAKRRLIALNVPCWRCGVHYADLNPIRGQAGRYKNPLGSHQLEAHHFDVEYSLQNGVNVEQWWDASLSAKREWWEHTYSDLDGFLAAHPEMDPSNHEDVFLAFMESEGNLMQLCDICHRSTHQGIHRINYPDWRPLAVWRRDTPAHVQ